MNESADHIRFAVGGDAEQADENQRRYEGVSRCGMASTAFDIEVAAQGIESKVIRGGPWVDPFCLFHGNDEFHGVEERVGDSTSGFVLHPVVENRHVKFDMMTHQTSVFDEIAESLQRLRFAGPPALAFVLSDTVNDNR